MNKEDEKDENYMYEKTERVESEERLGEIWTQGK